MFENPVMTFPIKKRISTDLFIDRMVANSGQNYGNKLIEGTSIPCAEILPLSKKVWE